MRAAWCLDQDLREQAQKTCSFPGPGGLGIMASHGRHHPKGTTMIRTGAEYRDSLRDSREIRGGRICVTPDKAAFDAPETRPWMEKFHTINDDWVASRWFSTERPNPHASNAAAL